MTIATLADGITTTTNGTYAAVQKIGSTDPVIVEVYGKALGTSGAFSATIQIQTSPDASSWTTQSTLVIGGTAESKPFDVQQKVAVPFVRVNVSAISGTGASVSAEVSF
jgi:hypothetical protein